MCVLLLHHRTRPDHPLVLLANRDEAFDRPFDPPRLLDTEHGIVAPRDRRAGGTWLGLNRHGLVAAVTNRREPSSVAGERSRGLLVLDALRLPSARAAVDWARSHLVSTAYAAFHLMLADGEEAFIVRHRGGTSPHAPQGEDVIVLAPGTHVLTNLHEPGEVPLPPDGEPRPEEPIEATLDRLQRVAADDQTPLPGEHRLLKRGGERGTVCSAVLAPPHFRFASGPPDRTPFLPVDPRLVRNVR